MRQHSAAAQAAKVKELLTWQRYQCFSRKPRKQARRVVYVGLKTLVRRSVSFARALLFEGSRTSIRTHLQPMQ
eukprot:1995692-Lingulodinium_polyedra.AAC.1